MVPNKWSQKIYRYRWYIGIILIILCVIFEIHGSSIGMYSDILHTPNIDLFGHNRPIRSDEWLVNTPFAFSQYYNHFCYFSNIVRGTTTDMFMIYGQPVMEWPVIFRPFQWGYIFLNPAKGLSFFWMGRWIILFLLSFEFGMLLCLKKKLLALVYAFLMAFSPIIQWWFAINSLAEILIFGQAGVLTVYAYLHTVNYKKRLMYALILVWIIGVYIFAIYPAWQIPCAYIYLVMLVWIYIDSRESIVLTKVDIGILLGIIILLTILLVPILQRSENIIAVVKNTVYPGSRFILGGEYSVLDFIKTGFNFIWGIWLPKMDLSQMTNNCEAARMFDLAPLGFILAVYYCIKQEKDILLCLLITVQILFLSWFLIKWPVIIAKITLMSSVPGQRLFLGFGIVNIMMLLRVMALENIGISSKKAVIITVFGMLLCTTAAWKFYPDLFGIKNILISSGIIATLWYLAIRNKQNIFSLFMIFLLCFMGGTVNPIAHGTDSIYKSVLVAKIQEMAKQDNGLWIVTDSITLNDLPIMAGAPTINSVNTYPVLERWTEIDMQGENKVIYNRYAHIIVHVLNEKTMFKLNNADCFDVILNLNDLKILQVRHILATKPLNGISDNTIKLKRVFEDHGLYIYDVEY